MKRALLALLALVAAAVAVPATAQVTYNDDSGVQKYVKPSSPLPVRPGAVAPIPSTVLEASHVVCAGPCNLYSGEIVTGATSGFLLIFDATTAPADGAVAPKKCFPVAANSGLGMSNVTPLAFSVGVVVVFSSGANCLTKTGSATAYFSFEGI